MIWKGIRIAVRNLLLLAMMGSRVAHAQETPASEFEVEAAFLYHFAEFVTWPPEAFAAADSSINIGILGEDPFGAVLESTIKNKTVKDRPLQILHPGTKAISEIKRCHILFIAASERRRIPEIIEALQNASILTVSRADRFIQLGGMVHFLLEGKKVRFEINDDKAKSASLKISAKLLRLARIRESS